MQVLFQVSKKIIENDSGNFEPKKKPAFEVSIT